MKKSILLLALLISAPAYALENGSGKVPAGTTINLVSKDEPNFYRCRVPGEICPSRDIPLRYTSYIKHDTYTTYTCQVTMPNEKAEYYSTDSKGEIGTSAVFNP